MEKAEDFDKKASEFVFRANNSDSQEDEIDLHGLYVKEAEDILETRIQACLQRRASHLDVIVGKGIHSENGVAKLKPAVERLCQKHRFKFALDEDNSGVIVIDFTGSGGHVPLAHINRPQKAHGQPQHGQYPGQQYSQQPQYSQQQQQQQQQKGGNGLYKILCTVLRHGVKACLKSVA